MCTNPIKIKNCSRRYRDGIDKMFFRVPCGHCKECIERKKDDWFVRAFFEYQRVKKIGGSCFFPTFSYSNEYLPIWRDTSFEWNGKPFECPVFDPTHVKRFRDKLRVYLGREWYRKMINGNYQYRSCSSSHSRVRSKLIKDGFSLYWSPIDFSDEKNTIRFFISAEYGTTYGRSHLHALLFLPFPITEEKMLFFLRKAWIYGWTMKSKQHGLTVQSAKAVSYCMKYIEKPQSWFNKYGIYEYIKYLENQVDKVNKIGFLPFTENAELKLKEFKRCTPSHFQSIGFGYDMIPYLENNSEIVLNGKIDLSKLNYITSNRMKFSIPRYILRKLLVVKDEFNTDVPSEFQRDIFFSRLENMWNSDVQKLSYLQSYESFKTHFEFLRMSEQVTNDYWQTLKLVSDKIPQLVIYNSVFRDVPINGDLPFMDLNTYMDSALDFAFEQKFNNSFPTAKGFSARDCHPNLFDENRFTYGNLSCFHGFDASLRLIEKLESVLSQEVTRAYMLKLSNMEKLWTPKGLQYIEYNFIV